MPQTYAIGSLILNVRGGINLLIETVFIICRIAVFTQSRGFLTMIAVVAASTYIPEL